MKRIRVLENGKIIPGQEANFELASKKEGEALQKIDALFREEEPDLYKDIPQVLDWKQEGGRSIISASFRFGNGSFYMEFDDGNYIGKE